MNRRLFIATFENEADLLAAAREIRARGFHIDDAYTPYPVHGLSEALGLRPSRLGRVCFACGAIGAAIALYFEFYLSASNWPLNVGGRPWNSLPAFIPIAFELTVLFAGVGTLIAFLLRYRLLPGRRPNPIDGHVTDNHFVIVIVETDAGFEPAELEEICAQHHSIATAERVESDSPQRLDEHQEKEAV